MNILLTGGTGYIGSHTAISLEQAGYRVIIVDNFSNSRPNVLEQLAEISGKHFSFIEGDLRDFDLVESTLRGYNIDVVMHFAGKKSASEGLADPIDYYENNVVGTVTLLKAMNRVGIKKLVFSSSAMVYGEPKYLPLDESHPKAASNPYARSKLQIEEILFDIANSDTNWHIACLRYFNPVGAHESGLIGEQPNSTPNNLMPYIAQVAGDKQPFLKIFGRDYDTPDGTGVRDYIHVMDIADGHKSALHFLSSNPGWHVFNLGSGKGYSVIEMLRAFETQFGRPIPHRFVDRRKGDIGTCYADPRLAKQYLNWEVTRSLTDMCFSTIKHLGLNSDEENS